MTKFTVNRKQFAVMLNSFGNTIGDLRLRTGDHLLTGTVGLYSHYLSLSIPCKVEKAGRVAIGDLNRVRSFLKGGADDLTVQQQGESKMLYLTCGNSKIHLPGVSKVESHQHAGVIERLLVDCANSQWTEWSGKAVGCSGVLTKTAVRDIINIHSVLGENSLYTVEYHTKESEIVVKAGRQSKGRMFVTLPVDNAKGGGTYHTSNFGANFPILLKSLPEGDLTVHLGEAVPIIFRHESSGTLLMVFDCDYEEGWE